MRTNKGWLVLLAAVVLGGRAYNVTGPPAATALRGDRAAATAVDKKHKDGDKKLTLASTTAPIAARRDDGKKKGDGKDGKLLAAAPKKKDDKQKSSALLAAAPKKKDDKKKSSTLLADNCGLKKKGFPKKADGYLKTAVEMA